MLFLQVPRNSLKILTIIIYPGEIYQKDKQYHPTYYTRSTLHCITHIVKGKEVRPLKKKQERLSRVFVISNLIESVGIRLFTQQVFHLQFLIFIQLLQIPKTVINFNEISDCVVYKEKETYNVTLWSSQDKKINFSNGFLCVYSDPVFHWSSIVK